MMSNTYYFSHFSNVNQRGRFVGLFQISKKEYMRYNYRSVLAELPNRPHILEIGPGLGEFIELIQEIRPQALIDIVDSDQSVIEHLQSCFTLHNAICSNTVVNQDKKLRMYDLVFMSQVLEHISRKEYIRLFSVLDKHLNPGAAIIIMVPNCGNPFSMVEQYGDLQHVTGFTSDSLKELAGYVGLSKTYTSSVQPYSIPPINLSAILRLILQKILHVIILTTSVINGGLFSTILTPDIVLIMKKDKKEI